MCRRRPRKAPTHSPPGNQQTATRAPSRPRRCRCRTNSDAATGMYAHPVLARMTVHREFRPADHSFKGLIMRQHILAAAFFASLLLNGTAFAGAALENVPLKWTPTSTLSEMGAIDISGPLLTTKIQVDALLDTRQNPPLVAENREKADKVRRMTTSSDVAAFLT